MKRILVSACLLGVACRYDGKSKEHPEVLSLLKRDDLELIPVCGEIMGGLPTPRPAAELCGGRVITEEGKEVTEEYRKGAEAVLRLAMLYQTSAALLKERSPSCGSGEIHDGSFSGALTEGWGMTARALKNAGIPVYGESDIREMLQSL